MVFLFLSVDPGESSGICKEEDGVVSILEKSDAIMYQGSAFIVAHMAPCRDGTLYIVGARKDHREDLILSWTLGYSAAEFVAGSFQDVAGFAVDLEGALFITEENQHQVVRLDLNSGERAIVAGGNRQGNRLTQLRCPGAIAIGSDRSIYIADRGNNRIVNWCCSGHKELTIKIVVSDLFFSYPKFVVFHPFP